VRESLFGTIRDNLDNPSSITHRSWRRAGMGGAEGEDRVPILDDAGGSGGAVVEACSYRGVEGGLEEVLGGGVVRLMGARQTSRRRLESFRVLIRTTAHKPVKMESPPDVIGARLRFWA